MWPIMFLCIVLDAWSEWRNGWLKELEPGEKYSDDIV